MFLISLVDIDDIDGAAVTYDDVEDVSSSGIIIGGSVCVWNDCCSGLVCVDPVDTDCAGCWFVNAGVANVLNNPICCVWPCGIVVL